MDKNNLGQEQAFPRQLLEPDLRFNPEKGNGMSKRFYAACAAMQSMLSNEKFVNSVCDLTMTTTRHGSANEFIIKSAYELADELLKQENL